MGERAHEVSGASPTLAITQREEALPDDYRWQLCFVPDYRGETPRLATFDQPSPSKPIIPMNLQADYIISESWVSIVA